MKLLKNHLIIKKCVRLIAEKFSYSTDYLKEIIIISNQDNRIEIELKGNQYEISYEYLSKSENITTSIEELFDFLIQLLMFEEKQNISLHKGEIITIENWITDEQISLKEIEQVLSDLKKENIENYQFRGNRIMAEYYKGIIILLDDLGYYKSEIIIT
jgi:hypothetical protein